MGIGPLAPQGAVLALGLCAVLGGTRSYSVIAEWAREAPTQPPLDSQRGRSGGGPKPVNWTRGSRSKSGTDWALADSASENCSGETCLAGGDLFRVSQGPAGRLVLRVASVRACTRLVGPGPTIGKQIGKQPDLGRGARQRVERNTVNEIGTPGGGERGTVLGVNEAIENG
jgi:hypothetical protein